MTRRPIEERVRGVLGALRFARIPVICALLLAALTTEPMARALELAVAAVVLGMGLALHRREILFGSQRDTTIPDSAAMEDHWRGGTRAA